ncbi:MAG: STAS domain-containing protein [Acidimicrobiales bacterium]
MSAVAGRAGNIDQRAATGCLTLGGVMLDVRVASSGAWTVLGVHGEIDMATCPQLRQEIVGQISQGRLHLEIDLSGVDFIDSTGLGVLIGGLKRARAQGGDLRVSGIHGRIKKVFDLTGLGDVLAVVDGDQPGDPEVPVGG